MSLSVEDLLTYVKERRTDVRGNEVKRARRSQSSTSSSHSFQRRCSVGVHLCGYMLAWWSCFSVSSFKMQTLTLSKEILMQKAEKSNQQYLLDCKGQVIQCFLFLYFFLGGRGSVGAWGGLAIKRSVDSIFRIRKLYGFSPLSVDLFCLLF